jgi:hypothetical protein
MIRNKIGVVQKQDSPVQKIFARGTGGNDYQLYWPDQKIKKYQIRFAECKGSKNRKQDYFRDYNDLSTLEMWTVDIPCQTTAFHWTCWKEMPSANDASVKDPCIAYGKRFDLQDYLWIAEVPRTTLVAMTVVELDGNNMPIEATRSDPVVFFYRPGPNKTTIEKQKKMSGVEMDYHLTRVIRTAREGKLYTEPMSTLARRDAMAIVGMVAAFILKPENIIAIGKFLENQTQFECNWVGQAVTIMTITNMANSKSELFKNRKSVSYAKWFEMAAAVIGPIAKVIS